MEIGDKIGEASSYGNLETVFQSVVEYDKAIKYSTIRIQIGDKEGEAADYGNLGILYLSVVKHGMAEVFLQKGLLITRDIKDLGKEFNILCGLTIVKLCHFKSQECVSEYDQKCIFRKFFRRQRLYEGIVFRFSRFFPPKS